MSASNLHGSDVPSRGPVAAGPSRPFPGRPGASDDGRECVLWTSVAAVPPGDGVPGRPREAVPRPARGGVARIATGTAVARASWEAEGPGRRAGPERARPG